MLMVYAQSLVRKEDLCVAVSLHRVRVFRFTHLPPFGGPQANQHGYDSIQQRFASNRVRCFQCLPSAQHIEACGGFQC